MSEYIADFQFAFLLSLSVTLLIEVPLLVLLLRAARFSPAPYSRIISAGGLCSIATLPYLWFILPHYVNGSWYFLLGESLVTLAETAILQLILSLKLRHAFASSVICNAVSALLGPKLVMYIASMS